MTFNSHLRLPLIVVCFLFGIIFTSDIADSYTYEKVLRIEDGEVIAFDKMINEISSADIIFVGEIHGNADHHAAQYDIIKRLASSGLLVSIGLEMFTSQDQEMIDKWIRGGIDVRDFQQIYYSYWNIPWDLYADIFYFARDFQIQMIGLNLPREITNKVSREGIHSLSAEELSMLPPDITCEDIDDSYMEFIRLAFDAYHQSDKEFRNFCRAQITWDKSMAWNLLDYIDKSSEQITVVLAGIGHSWKQGIPLHISQYSDYSYKVILPGIQGEFSNKISNNHADYLLLQ